MTEVPEAYNDYMPPAGTRKTVEELLQSVPKEQLAGLKSVVLTNAEALTGARKRRGYEAFAGQAIKLPRPYDYLMPRCSAAQMTMPRRTGAIRKADAATHLPFSPGRRRRHTAITAATTDPAKG
jgi:hypothetical protein